VVHASGTSGELAGRLLDQLPRWISWLLIVLLGVRAALLVTDLAGPATVARSTAAAPPAAARKLVDVPSILRANLFGKSPTPTGTDAPVTTMNLKCPLVFADVRNEKRGWAAIGPSTNDVKVYEVGDDLPNGARLHAVYVDRVLLDRGGSIEALLVEKRDGTFAGPVSAPPLASAGPSMDRVQQIVRDNPGIINQVMSRQAILRDGRLVGVRVNPANTPQGQQAFNRLGLRAGDEVTAINGMQLDDQSRMNEIFMTLDGAPQARITVNRSGREMELNLNLAEIASEVERLNEIPPGEEPDSGIDANAR
jgi:general secretion pathway protein C